jgi:hypothetical protein
MMCVEQFVAVGHSDGATAIYHFVKGKKYDVAGGPGNAGTGYEHPAYLGLIDIVRKKYNFNVNTDDGAYIEDMGHPEPPGFRTVIGCYRQNKKEKGWKGYIVKDADYNKLVPGVDHFEIHYDPGVKKDIAEHAADAYVRAMKEGY